MRTAFPRLGPDNFQETAFFSLVPTPRRLFPRVQGQYNVISKRRQHSSPGGLVLHEALVNDSFRPWFIPSLRITFYYVYYSGVYYELQSIFPGCFHVHVDFVALVDLKNGSLVTRNVFKAFSSYAATSKTR